MNPKHKIGEYLQFVKDAPKFDIKVGDVYEIVSVYSDGVTLELKDGKTGRLANYSIDNDNPEKCWAISFDEATVKFDSIGLSNLI